MMIALGLAVCVVAYMVVIYNNLVFLKRSVDKNGSNIEVLLKQRNAELPKLIETCKQHMKHEQDSLLVRDEAGDEVDYGHGYFRVTEHYFRAGDPLYVIGSFVTLSQNTLGKKASKATQDVFKKCKKHWGFLLGVQPDANKADAPQGQEQEVLPQEPVHLMSSRGIPSRRPYIVSNKSQEAIVRAYSWKGIASLVAFFAFCIGALFIDDGINAYNRYIEKEIRGNPKTKSYRTDVEDFIESISKIAR